MLLVWQPQSSPERVFSFCDVFSYLALEKLQNNWIYLPQINVLCPVRVVHSHTQLLQTKDCLVWVCLGQASRITNSSFATNLKDPWWAGIAEVTSQEILIGKQVRVGHNEPGLSSAEGGNNDW